jgi:transcriptional regulatory protein LevR
MVHASFVLLVVMDYTFGNEVAIEIFIHILFKVDRWIWKASKLLLS